MTYSLQLFGFNVIQDGRFRSRTILVPSSTANESFTGRITCATAFSRHYSSNQTTSILTTLITLSERQGRNVLAVATEDGIYLGLHDNPDHPVQVLRLPNVTQMAALVSHECFVLIFEKTLHSYSLEPLISVALGRVPSEPVEQTMEMIAPQHKEHLAFFRVGPFDDRDYCSSARCSVTPSGNEMLTVRNALSGLWDP